MGRHSNAASPGFKPRKSHVMRAELSMRRFSTSIGFGAPVLPLVCTSMVGAVLFHSARKAERVKKVKSEG